MLNGVRIFTNDKIWRQILADFGATVTDAPTVTDVNFDDLAITDIITPLQLKAAILSATDYGRILNAIFGTHVSLPQLQAGIIVLLHKSGGMRYAELRSALGFMPNITSHAVDTAIYQLRQKFGREFIINTDGVYKLGKL
ncbi:MAG: helix-turn-helix domain-containing protein [Alphaproteobacteria bacterium]|nr:helix-turn-helix domain-containing protein [Alphaproteobacteria bacterium]